MNEVTRILSAIEQGDPQAAAQLLPLVYTLDEGEPACITSDSEGSGRMKHHLIG
jgi:hypothetical protein